jgi:hypothetical protein
MNSAFHGKMRVLGRDKVFGHRAELEEIRENNRELVRFKLEMIRLRYSLWASVVDQTS